LIRPCGPRLKRALTDPRLFSGIGNAYSDEILHRARLSPLRLTSRLTDGEISRLREAARAVLRDRSLSRLLKDDWPRTIEEMEEGLAAERAGRKVGKPGAGGG
jgi:formamidopyrimidine-DNA glycosylase